MDIPGIPFFSFLLRDEVEGTDIVVLAREGERVRKRKK